MPDPPTYAKRAHPGKHAAPGATAKLSRRVRTRAYAELRCQSNFSFLRGASHPEELAERATKLGYTALAITDRNTLAGVVRMHGAAKASGLKLIVGAEITPADAPPLLLYAPDRAAYGRLARIITQGRLRSIKGACAVTLADIAEHHSGLLAAILPPAELMDPPGGVTASTAHRASDPDIDEDLLPALRTYRDLFGDRLYLAAGAHGGPDDARHLAAQQALARAIGVPLLATNDVHYHEPQRRFLQDVLTCIREHCTLSEAGTRLFANAERHLKPVEEMHRLFHLYPGALAATLELAERCTFRLDELRYEYPEALCPPGRLPGDFLAELTWAGAAERYPAGIPHKVCALLWYELALIAQLHYEPYFLTVWDIVKFARSRNILCQGRGSAANSAVCYCLGITSVDPDRSELLFERFVSAERNEPPDIDVDFEHERREEVFEYIYNKYGRDHAGIVAEVISYRARSAIRDVGKALGLPLSQIGVLAKKHEWWDKGTMDADSVRQAGFDPADRTVRLVGRLVQQLLGFPRHLSQHVGGFVITRGPLCELVPLENGAMPGRTFIEWDKDDIDALGILKIDCLALGMLTAIRKCLEMVNEATERRSDEATEDGASHGVWRTELNVGPQADKDVKAGGASKGDGREHQEFPWADCMAKGNGTRETDLSGDRSLPGYRAVWPDGPDAPGGDIHPVKHRRRSRERKPLGLSSVSAHGAGIADGATDAAHPDDRVGDRRGGEHAGGVACRNGSSASGAHPQPGEAEALGPWPSETSCPLSLSPPTRLRASVPSCLAPVPPSSLRRSVASSLCLHTIPPEDPAVYDMICHADTVGVFQIESRAQMSMLPRLKPRCFYDLVIEVAIVRPGPIQGGMVHPYLRRRSGEEPITYPSQAVKEVLRRTLGVPLFQEQAMRLAIVAGFSPGEADQLRRAMGAWRRSGDIERFHDKLVNGLMEAGLSQEFAQRCYEQICGFGAYGFPESHAASFALLVYVSAWLKRYYPAAFCAALINSQPMGFYQPAQLVRDAQAHGVTVLPIDVNESGYDCRLESDEGMKARRHEGTQARREEGTGHREQGPPASLSDGGSGSPAIDPATQWGAGGPAVRLGMRLIKGISQAPVEGIERAKRERSFTSVLDLARRSGAPRATLARLAAADAMRSLGLNRREALWQVLALRDDPPLFADYEPQEPAVHLPQPTLTEVVLTDYQATGLSLVAHPLALIRAELARLRVQPASVLREARLRHWMRVAGLVLVRQRPTTAGGIVFCTLEDETGTANLIIGPKVYERFRRTTRDAAILVAEGRVERQGEVVHLQTSRLRDVSAALRDLRSVSRDFH